ncbi:HipA domain-containing protein [Carboxydothermus ferrireducens]|uniref:HipA-like C-terminal domain-containing protein n=1 Tax=Carboxydothermus ferrireducens DSM 11255 TaxID=1119529 RepID=A0ABX2RAP2_9THEO|nr:hypothetical protein [Carboxydothermus ferrireducens]NYE57206.1 hypothetical protein [Carboxydothermus ferrireducens DSM 11255]
MLKPFEINDVSDWTEYVGLPVKGKIPKTWLVSPELNKYFLFKVPRQNTGEIWAEKIFSEVGKLVGIKTHNVYFAKRMSFDGSYIIGIICENIARKSENLIEAYELFSTEYNNFDKRNDIRYNVSNTLKIVKSQFSGIVERVDLENILNDFFTMIIFDALMGYTDRHCENWGLLFSEGKISFAPLYDNGSCLGREFCSKINNCNTEIGCKKILQKLNSPKDFSNYLIKAKSLILYDTCTPESHFNLIQKIVNSKNGDRLIRIWENIIARISDEQIIDVINKIPEEIMCINQKNFAQKIIFERRRILNEILMGG